MGDNSGSHESVDRPMNGRDKWRHKTAQPLTFGDVLKLIATGVGLFVLAGGGITAYATFKTETRLTDATTLEKLKALEVKTDAEIKLQREAVQAGRDKHDQDWKLTMSALQEFDHDLHELDTRQQVFAVEQKIQTELLKEIKAELKD